jgi:flagellar assembly protein FliH
LSNSGTFLLKAEGYSWQEDPFRLRDAALSPEEVIRLKAVLDKSLPKPEPKEPVTVTDPEILALRLEVRKLRGEAIKRLKDAEGKAAEILQWAEKQTETKFKAAQQDGYQKGLEAGTSEGHEKGLKKGEEEGLSRWVELLTRWQSVISETVDSKKNYFSDREPLMVQIALEACAKILVREVKSDPELVLNQVRNAIKRATDRSRLVVHLNPDDLQKAKSADEASFKMLDGIKQIDFVADDKVMQGGAYIETDSGSIDARLETQLAEMAKSLIETARHAE